jgi:hypothetical protein
MSEEKVLCLALKFKPTKDTPRPGTANNGETKKTLNKNREIFGAMIERDRKRLEKPGLPQQTYTLGLQRWRKSGACPKRNWCASIRQGDRNPYFCVISRVGLTSDSSGHLHLHLKKVKAK